MRTAIALFCLASLASTAFAQSPDNTQDESVQVRTLTIISDDLPEAERLQIADAYRGKTYPLMELTERVRQNLRDLGYAEARAEMSHMAELLTALPTQPVDISFQVKAGSKYRLDTIVIEGNAVMSRDQILQQFPIHGGEVFNATSIGKGLDNLKNLYASEGYVNFGAIPKLAMNEAQHTLNLTIDIDEGARFSFGRLFFDGVEPHAGASKELLAAWKSIQGKTYSPQLLADWLAVNATFVPASERVLGRCINAHQDPETRRVDFQLDFP
jgi:outer membrane translocation and assembly module TamA